MTTMVVADAGRAARPAGSRVVASAQPAMIRGNAASSAPVRGSSRKATPAATATAGLT
ncbi:hypothetical protein ACTWP5_06565 [Streptomyces sp. 4N509B]|uniref:hypothetical protein n=1 Tax=Streptomyces sp. 4N509B TaxID=3457413 RepID=UPI003FD07D6B